MVQNSNTKIATLKRAWSQGGGAKRLDNGDKEMKGRLTMKTAHAHTTVHCTRTHALCTHTLMQTLYAACAPRCT